MKRLSAALLAFALLLTACTGAPTGDASSQPASSTGAGPSSVLPSREDASSALLSSDETASAFSSGTAPSSRAASSAFSSSAAASSKATPSSQAATSSAASVKWVDVDALFAASGKSMTADVSSCFPKDAGGYLINGGTASKPYLVDADTLVRLTGKPVSGSGTVKWVGFDKSINNAVNPDPFTGVVPVSKLHDPLYMSTALPSEVNTFMTRRINASNLYPPASTHTEAHLIGAVYRNVDDPPANDNPVTICISNFRLLFHSADKGWFIVDNFAAPVLGDSGKVNHMYYLPWQLGLSYIIPSPKVIRYPNNTNAQYIQLAINGSYFNADALVDANGEITVGNAENGSDRKLKNGSLTYRTGGATYNNGSIAEACLHFWGNKATFASHGLAPTDVDGMVSAFQIWIKEPEMVGKFGVAIGIDQTDGKGNIDQAYSGRNYSLTTEPQWIIGHTVGPKAYDAVMDSEAVQRLIGMK